MQLAMKTFAVDEKSVSGYIVSGMLSALTSVCLHRFSIISFSGMS